MVKALRRVPRLRGIDKKIMVLDSSMVEHCGEFPDWRRFYLRYIFLDSSMVEHSAVNRVVVGSSPTRGAEYLVCACTNLSTKLYSDT